MLLDEPLELADELGMTARLEVRLDPAFDRGEAKLLEPGNVGLREGLEGEVREGGPPPERQGGPQLRASVLRFERARLVHGGAESVDVDRARRDVEAITRCARLQHLRAEQLAELRDEVLERCKGGPRRLLSPDRVEQPVDGDDPVRFEEEYGKDRALLLAAERQRPRLRRNLERPEDHFQAVMSAILDGRLIPVLGTDVAELAARLAQRFGYPTTNGHALSRVAQYIAVMKGSGPLHDELHALLDVDAVPTEVHRFFAALPPLLRERGAPHQLIVTTSYDVALERAFADAGEEIDVVAYLATGRHRGKFCHLAPDAEPRLIDLPNEYIDLSLERRTVILKVHGQVDRSHDRAWESFVVTEDDYIDYLAQADVASVVPVGLAAKLRRSHFLFLGYTMADWNLRVILNRLWGDQPLSYRSWAVQPQPLALEREFWRRRDVDVFELPLQKYVEGLSAHAGLAEVAA